MRPELNRARLFANTRPQRGHGRGHVAPRPSDGLGASGRVARTRRGLVRDVLAGRHKPAVEAAALDQKPREAGRQPCRRLPHQRLGYRLATGGTCMQFAALEIEYQLEVIRAGMDHAGRQTAKRGSQAALPPMLPRSTAARHPRAKYSRIRVQRVARLPVGPGVKWRKSRHGSSCPLDDVGAARRRDRGRGQRPRGPFLPTVPLSFNLTLDALRRGRVTPAVGGGRLCERRCNLVLPAGIC